MLRHFEMRFQTLLIVVTVVLLLASCTAPVVTPTATATIAPTPTSRVDPCLTTAKTYKPGSLPPARIAFECYTNPNRTINLYIFDTTTGRITGLTSNAFVNGDGRWSPDGRKIAFRSNRDGSSAIYTMDADGGQVERLAEGMNPRWSPDGEEIAFVRDSEIYKMKTDGSQQVRLTNNSRRDYSPEWSPDGKRIAFFSLPGEIHIVNVNSGQEINRNDHPYQDSYPTWSPDGKTIAFFTFLDKEPEIFKANADGTDRVQLTHNLPLNEWFAWSPDGRQIAFVADRLYIMNTDGEQVRAIASLPSPAPTWSPDGKYLTFSTDQLYVVKVDDGQVTQLTDGPEYKTYPIWSPK